MDPCESTHEHIHIPGEGPTVYYPLPRKLGPAPTQQLFGCPKTHAGCTNKTFTTIDAFHRHWLLAHVLKRFFKCNVCYIKKNNRRVKISFATPQQLYRHRECVKHKSGAKELSDPNTVYLCRLCNYKVNDKLDELVPHWKFHKLHGRTVMPHITPAADSSSSSSTTPRKQPATKHTESDEKKPTQRCDYCDRTRSASKKYGTLTKITIHCELHIHTACILAAFMRSANCLVCNASNAFDNSIKDIFPDITTPNNRKPPPPEEDEDTYTDNNNNNNTDHDSGPGEKQTHTHTTEADGRPRRGARAPDPIFEELGVVWHKTTFDECKAIVNDKVKRAHPDKHPHATNAERKVLTERTAHLNTIYAFITAAGRFWNKNA